jgi:hypothetical protein
MSRRARPYTWRFTNMPGPSLISPFRVRNISCSTNISKQLSGARGVRTSRAGPRTRNPGFVMPELHSDCA